MKPIAMIAALLLGSVATPLLAQAAPPPMDGPGREGPADRGGGRMGGRAFASLSEAGQATMREAMQAAAGDRTEDRAKVKASRDKMLDVLAADRLDTAALKRAMDEERALSSATQERRQAAMYAGFTKLSVADRKAFVVEAKQIRDRMQDRMDNWRERRGQRRNR